MNELIVFTDFQRSEYARLKSQAKQGWLLFAEAIREIHNAKLYKVEYNTFEEFCECELNITKTHAYRLLESTETMKVLQMSPMGDILPETERQARPLTKLEPPLQVIAWAETVENNETITAKKVSEVVDTYTEINNALKEENKVTVNIFNPNPANKQVTERLQNIANLPIQEQIKEVKQIAREIKAEENKEKIETRKAEIQKQVEQIENGELPELKGLFDVVSIDPPWAYEEKGGFSNEQHNPETNRGGVAYPTMTVSQIKEIQLPLKDDSVVFLWTTHAFLRDSFDILEGWGLEYKATMVWDKMQMGMGRTIRLQCEFCLIGIKGKPFIQGSSVRDIISEQRREHSRKPDSFFNTVDKMCFGRKLEYFSRESREGWEIFGNDINKF